MTTLVLGGSGFLGRRVLSRLLADGKHVIATSRSGNSDLRAPNLKWRSLDFSTFEEWDDLLYGVTAVYHLAWSTTPSTASANPIYDLETNVRGSLRLVEALRTHRRALLVFASSGGTVYGRSPEVPASETFPTDPVGTYAVSKLAVEHYIRQFVERHVVLRIGNLFGCSQVLRRDFGVVSAFCWCALTQRPIVIFGDGSMLRDYVHVDDAARALILAATVRSEYNLFNIGTGHGRSVNDIVSVIERTLGRPLEVEHRLARAYDVTAITLDSARAHAELQWRPRIAFEDGVRAMLGLNVGYEIGR